MVAISKQLSCQKFIYKIHSSRLRKSKWSLTLPIDEARKNEEVIALASSQVLRWIDELNGIEDADEQARAVKSEIREIKHQPNSRDNKRRIRELYGKLDKIQFVPDYMCLIIDRNSDYRRAANGFRINGIKYIRLLGTNGGIKNSTIVFVSERVCPVIRARIENGRNPSTPLVTAKLEAYKALSCSASIPVSMPDGILVVDDAMTEFDTDIMYMTDENTDEPIMELRKNQHIEHDATDGCGMMLPSLAEKWGKDLGLDYMPSAVNTRLSFEKGCVFTFDFVEFGEKVAHNYLVKDAWGNEVDIRNVELVLTTSMLKLWDSYKSLDNYLENCKKNHYTFGITKVAPEQLEKYRNTNYQFLNSFDFSDDDIDELIAPTMQEFNEVLNGDWRKTVLFLLGSGVNANNVSKLNDDYIKALMIDHRMIDDPFVQNNIYRLIRNRIDQAKIGVLKVHANYSIITGDPYLLCQSMFGLEKTGLLKAGEIYNKYWSDEGSDKLLCLRAPMTSHSNIRAVRPVNNDKTEHWYRYIKTCTIFNGWDTATDSLNGADYDGDIIMLTDNPVMLRKHRPLPSLMCVQRRASKCIPTEQDFIKSNIASFGNTIGQTTNWVTSMFDIQSTLDKDSEEYKVIDYRIASGQLYQQNAIDAAKGIIAKPMPRNWHDRYAANKIEDESKRELYMRIVADKKPYFMRYIYPALMRNYKNYIRSSDSNSMIEFGMPVEELKRLDTERMTDRQKEFVKYFDKLIPVSMHDCVANRICRKFEKAFDGYIGKHNSSVEFDYRIMRSGREYGERQYKEIARLYKEYNSKVAEYKAFAAIESLDSSEVKSERSVMDSEFLSECSMICQDDKALCNILLDLCYTRSSSKWFAWNICGEQIIRNLLSKNDNIISYPTLDENGDIEYCGDKFSEQSTKLEVVE